MATVTLSLNGRPYEIACDDGQEERLQTLGIDLDSDNNATGEMFQVTKRPKPGSVV